ncbi:MAG: hypothetical protein WDO68_19250 [Gammaproteobacteria bacterium]
MRLLSRSDLTPDESADAAAALREIEAAFPTRMFDPPTRKRFMLRYSRIGALDRAFELAFDSLDHHARTRAHVG